MSKVLSIHVYPIKSLGGISLQQAQADTAGFKYDRRWMLVDGENNFMSQRKTPRLCMFQQRFEKDQLIVSHKGSEVRMPLEQAEGSLEVFKIWHHDTKAFEVDPAVSAWFERELQMKCRLVRMNEAHYRLSAENGDLKMSLADGYPYLFLGTESLAFLNSKLDEAVDMNRFRPNIVYQTAKAHEEDQLNVFGLGEAEFKGSHPCGRCVMVGVDQTTGISAQEPLRTLNTYRKVADDNRVNFGMNVFCNEAGIVKVGDSIRLH